MVCAGGGNKKTRPGGRASLRHCSDRDLVGLGDGDEVDTTRVGLRIDNNLKLLASLMGVEHVDIGLAHHEIPIEVNPSDEGRRVTHLATLTRCHSGLGAQFGALSFQESLHEHGVHEARGAVLVNLGVPGKADQLVSGDGLTTGLDEVEQLLAFQRGAGKDDLVLGLLSDFLGGIHGGSLGSIHGDSLRGLLGSVSKEGLDFRGMDHRGVGVVGLGLSRSHGVWGDCL